jgi:hypothetical protein
LLDLSVCFVSLWLIPRPIVAITNIWIHGIYVCVCVCNGKKEQLKVVLIQSTTVD